jgi:glycosylphosphatidylinositol transamidase
MFLAALATLNFSLSVLVGVLCVPLSFVRSSTHNGLNAAQLAVLAVLNPCLVVQLGTTLMEGDLAHVLIVAAQGWHISGLWTQVVVWLVWFPAWVVSTVVVASRIFD